MNTTKLKFVLTAIMVILTGILFSACTKKNKTPDAPQPTPTPQMLELEARDKPYINLIPRSDGHELKLRIVNIPSFIEQLDYELVYLTQDDGLEMEKGVGDTVKLNSTTFERDLLLGTASCTNGCKYKYDSGVTGGTLSISFITKDNQVANFKTPFTLISSSNLKTLSLSDNSFSVSLTPKSKEFFVLLKNFGTKDKSPASSIFSVFSSGKGEGKIISTTPSNATKNDMNIIVGDYLIN